jgi:glycosyltransferase involved in cell wall biosynthesis
VVEPGANGALVPRGDVDAVAAALRSMVEIGEAGRRRLGESGRETAVREWSWPRLIDRMDNAYAGAIASRRSRKAGERQ